MRAAVLSLVCLSSLAHGGASATAQTVPVGGVLKLSGSPHIWISGADGKFHWAGDTRALAGRQVNWNSVSEVSADAIKAALRAGTIGDPWLSAGLVKDGDPIYLVKWESDQRVPKLQHIQSITDVELFGIGSGNYGQFVIDRGAWEQRFGISVVTLQREQLSPVTTSSVPDALVRAWRARLLVDDDTLIRALSEAWLASPSARWIYEAAAADSQLKIGWSAPNSPALGTYDSGTRRAVVRIDLRTERLAIVAAVLTHELYHAARVHQDVVPFLGRQDYAGACLEHELIALEWEASVYSALVGGVPPVMTERERDEAGVVTAWTTKTLPQWAIASPEYQSYCLGRVLLN